MKKSSRDDFMMFVHTQDMYTSIIINDNQGN